MKAFILFTLLAGFWLNNAKTQTSIHKEETIHYITDPVTNFDSLINKFKNQVIYVDIWATWCGPCVHDLRQKSNLKKLEAFASKNNIVLLYICCDRDGYTWKPFIAENHLSGYHILENDSLNHDLHDKFSFVERRNGVMKKGFYITRHLIIDQKGVVVDSMAERQGSSLLYKELGKTVDENSE